MSDPTRTRTEMRSAAERGPIVDAINTIEMIGAGRAAKIDRLKVAMSNARDGATMLQVVRGSLAGIKSQLTEMRLLAIQAAVEAHSDMERAALGRQFTEHRAEIDRIADAANFRGVRLLSGGTRVEEIVDQVAGQRFTPVEVGFNLRRESGLRAFSFEADTPMVEAGDRFRIEYRSADQRFTVANTTTGYAAHAGLPRHVGLRDEPIVVTVPEFGLTVLLQPAFPQDRDNLAAPGIGASNEFRIGVVRRKESRTVVTNALELVFQVGWGGGDQDRITLRLPSGHLADLDRDLAAANIATAREAHRSVGLLRRTMLEVARIRDYLDRMEGIFDDAGERLAAGAGPAPAPKQEKIVSIAKVAYARASLGRMGAPGGQPRPGGFLAARSVPVMRHFLLDLARAG